jgi:hypothetical protein
MAAAVAAAAVPAAAAEKRDHVHLQVTLAVAPSQPRAAGDALGIYAIEMLACKADKGARLHGNGLLAGLDRATDLLISSAWANHRDRFDRPGAKIVTIRAPLDRASRILLGDVVLPQGSYCQIRLTLTRLPRTTQPKALPPLDTSVRLARPGALPALAVAYPVPLELPLSNPWHAKHGAAALTITLDPAAANDVLADASLGEGAVVRLLTARWVQRSLLVLEARR